MQDRVDWQESESLLATQAMVLTRAAVVKTDSRSSMENGGLGSVRTWCVPSVWEGYRVLTIFLVQPSQAVLASLRLPGDAC